MSLPCDPFCRALSPQTELPQKLCTSSARALAVAVLGMDGGVSIWALLCHVAFGSRLPRGGRQGTGGDPNSLLSFLLFFTSCPALEWPTHIPLGQGNAAAQQ